MRRRFTVAISVIASVLALSGCGGPTDASVIARGNAICEQALAAIRVEPASPAGVAAAAAAVAREAQRLRALPRPAEHLRVLNRFISAEQTVSRDYSALARAERSGFRSTAGLAGSALASAARGAARSAKTYGLSRCAAAGPTTGS